jgi:hypothetical protein
MLIGLVVVVLIAWAWHWRTHPTVFSSAGNGQGGTLGAGQHLAAVGVTFPYPGKGEAVWIHSASPRVVQNTAAATFGFYVCTQDAQDWDGALGVAFGAKDFTRDCPKAQPVEDGTKLDTGSADPQQLVLVMTLRKPGSVLTEGVDLTYSYGVQRGTQSIGTHLRVTSR